MGNTEKPIRVCSLFSGGGGLDRGVSRALEGTTTVVYVEREAFACAVLVHEMEANRLDPAPIWTDVSTFDGHPWNKCVDLVVGGFPCQDISTAGKGAGIEAGARSGLWREFARVLLETNASFVFIENVDALVRNGLAIVLSDLDALGFDGQWCVLPASAVGAPHKRNRFFFLGRRRGMADSDVDRCLRAGLQLRGRGQEQAVLDIDGTSLVVVDNPIGSRLQGQWTKRQFREREEEVETIGTGSRVYAPFPPRPTEGAGWETYLEKFPGSQPAGVEPKVLRGLDGLAGWVDRTRLLGNGVVEMQAAFAFRLLANNFY